MKKLLLTTCISIVLFNFNLFAEAGEVHEHGVMKKGNILFTLGKKQGLDFHPWMRCSLKDGLVVKN